jgi:hypothetical protein
MNASYHFEVPTSLFAGKGFLLSMSMMLAAACASEPVWTLLRRENIRAPIENRITILQFSSPCPSH